MQFVYDQNASKELLKIRDENYRYLFKAKRVKIGDIVNFKNLEDSFTYKYQIKEIGKKEALLSLVDIINVTNSHVKKLHLIWCIIEPKVIYATLPMLNQIGVSKITFVYCDRSQKIFKLDLSKIQKILINSSQQCGRSDLMKIEVLKTLDDVLKIYSDFAVLDFGGKQTCEELFSILIGCEGGFSENERKKLLKNNKIGFKTDFILKSETAVVTIASKLLI